MNTYDKSTTELGDPIDDRRILFVPASGIADDGTIMNFSVAYPSKTITETGLSFVIDAADEDKITSCKIQNGVLIYEP